MLASSGSDSTVRLWDPSSHQALRVLQSEMTLVDELAINLTSPSHSAFCIVNILGS